MRESGFLAGQQSEQSKVVEPISLPLPLVTSNWSTGAGEVVGGAPSGKCSSMRQLIEPSLTDRMEYLRNGFIIDPPSASLAHSHARDKGLKLSI